jgi:hypothetical protein
MMKLFIMQLSSFYCYFLFIVPAVHCSFGPFVSPEYLHWRPCQRYCCVEVERNMNMMFRLGSKRFFIVAPALKISAWETLCFSSILDS